MDKNKCKTYFKIVGDFDCQEIISLIGITPNKMFNKNDIRRDNKPYGFSAVSFGLCDDYKVYSCEQMENTIDLLQPKIEILKDIKNKYKVDYCLEIVPQLYVNEITPCLAPSKKIIKFCYETDTEIDIDLYLYE